MGEMTAEALKSLLARCAARRVVVFGDVMLDEYVWGDVSRISPDAPVQVVDVRRRSHVLGGAGNVAANLAAAGARPVLVGPVGDDAAGRAVASLAAEAGVEAHLVAVAGRPTTVKTRVVARGQHLVRLDEETRDPLRESAQRELLDRLAHVLDACDALVVSDYAKGAVGPGIFPTLVALARRNCPRAPIVVDPKSSDVSVYRGATAITPNRKEAEAASGLPIRSEADLGPAGRRLIEATGASFVLITMGERGMAVVGPGESVEALAAEAREVYDVTGAGDTVIAYFALGLAAGASPSDAARVANAAAAIKVGKVGTASVTPAEIEDAASCRSGGSAKYVDLAQAIARLEHERGRGRSIVFTNGCFDLLHAGHVQLLESARRLGDVLVVALNSDASVRRLKGEGRPVVHQDDRVRMLCALDAVGCVVVFEDDTPLEVIRRIRPDVLVKGGDYAIDAIVGADVVRSYGGRVQTIPLVPGRSTTGLLDSLRHRDGGA